MSVKIKSIDEQHKKLIAMINDFYDNIKNRSMDENVSQLICEMKNYTLVHFRNEEAYMKHFHYSGYEGHKKEHAFFISKVTELEEKMDNGNLILSYEITGFLKDWLKNHIQITDMKYSDFFIKHGVT